MFLVGSRTCDSDLLFYKKKPMKPDGKLLTKLIIFSYRYLILLLGSTFVLTLEYHLYSLIVRSA